MAGEEDPTPAGGRSASAPTVAKGRPEAARGRLPDGDILDPRLPPELCYGRAGHAGWHPAHGRARPRNRGSVTRKPPRGWQPRGGIGVGVASPLLSVGYRQA